MNHYEILGIDRRADTADIKRAYFAAVKLHSPNSDPEGFKTARLAYETLSDAKKRAEYDSFFAEDDSVQAELLSARELLRQHKHKQAAEFLTKLRKAHPKSEDVALLLAEALLLNGNSGKAAKLCDELLAKFPGSAKVLLTQARIAVSRGFSQKSEEYFRAAISRAPEDGLVWAEYMASLMRANKRYLLPETGREAMAASKDIFKDNYILYLSCAIECVEGIFVSEPENAVFFLREFCEHFASDADPDAEMRENALKAISYFNEDIVYFEYTDKILSVLENNIHVKNNEDQTRVISELRQNMAYVRFRADDRVHKVLMDLTGFLLDEDEDRDERLGMECYIVGNLPELRKSIKVLRDEYPDFFKLNRQFYLDALNERKYEFLMDKYSSIHRRLISALGRHLSGTGADGYDEDDDDYDDDDDEDFVPEAQKPFVRETRKIGRNEPCPCGSGKKYKQCCGK